MNLSAFDSSMDRHVASSSVSVLSSPAPPLNPFESLWRDAGDVATTMVDCSPKKTPKKRLFANFFQRGQSKSKSPKSKTPQEDPFKLIPSHTSVSSASSGFPKSLVEPSKEHHSGSRSIASGSIYTSFSSATTDTQRKEMTSDNLLRGAQNVLGALGQQSQQRDMRQERSNQQRLAAPETASAIVGSTILVAPKSDTAGKKDATQQQQLQQKKSHSTPKYHLQESSPTSPPRIRRNHTPAGRSIPQSSTPAAPMRYQEHTALYTTPPQAHAPPALLFGGNAAAGQGVGKHVPQPPALAANPFQQPAFSPLVQPQATIEIARGVSVPLRGFTPETRDYVARGAMTGHLCQSCGCRIYCIYDAEYILCPNCRVIERLAAAQAPPMGGGGVAMGITEREWSEWTTGLAQNQS